MLPPRLDVRGVSATSAASSAQAVAAPRQEAFQRALSQMVGQTLPAQVLSKFNDGSFLVRVADTNARMLLPNGVNAGDELPLTVVSGQPRATLQVGAGNPQAGQMATFVAGELMPDLPAAGRLPSQEAAILNLSGKPPPGAAAEAEPAHPGQAGAAQAQGRALSPGAALLSKAPLLPADQLPALGRDTPQAALSPAARAIASALASAYTAPGVPVTINGKAPLSAGGPPDTGKLSEGLQRALGDSGLFYESHVAEWAEGKRPLQDLQREPQMQRAQGAAQGQAEAIAKTLAGPDLSAAQMINQQLHTHEQGKLMWQGEAWPGQPMQWLVEREQQRAEEGGQGGRGEGRDGEAAEVWRSGVRFRFPMLGQVAAHVTLAGGQLHIAVQSGSEDSAATLRAWAGALQQALQAAGTPLASLAIKAEAGHGAE